MQNRRTSDCGGRCYRHHRHRNCLPGQVGEYRGGLGLARLPERALHSDAVAAGYGATSELNGL